MDAIHCIYYLLHLNQNFSRALRKNAETECLHCSPLIFCHLSGQVVCVVFFFLNWGTEYSQCSLSWRFPHQLTIGAFSAPGGMFINAVHLKTSSTAYHSNMFAMDGSRPPAPKTPCRLQTRSHTHLSLLTGLTVCPVWLIVQLLGDHAQELGLVFVSVVVRGAYADQLGRDTRAEHRGRARFRLMKL